MTVPSYEDLTPGIPGVVDSEKVDQLAVFLETCPGSTSHSELPTPNVRLGSWERGIGNLYACLRRQDASGDRHAQLAVARDFSPRVRRVSDREVVLDVSGLGRLIGPPEEIARQLARALVDAGMAASVGIGSTQTVARVLARAGATGHGLPLHKDHEHHEDHEPQTKGLCDLCDLRGLCVGACGRGAWLLLPVDVLRELELLPPAMNPRERARIYETLERWGITTLGELAALPAAALSSRLGRRGLALQRLARGLDAAPFVPDGETPRYVGRLELDWPIEALEPLSFVFARLLEPLAAALERADRGAAAVRLDLRLTDRSTDARVLQLPAPMRDPRVLRTLLLLDLESTPPFAAAGEVMVDIVAIELDPAPARITQFSLLQRALPSPETLSTLTARLSALVGESRAGSPVLVDSHRPDAFVMERYAPEGAEAACHAAGADGADAGGGALRRCRPAVAIRVSVEHGRPVHIAASRRGVACGTILQAAGPWRASGGWWSTSGAGGCGQGNGAGAEGWNRDEWDVALKSGAVCRIYRDRTIDRWFLDGCYD
jgi:protein ImuB